MISELLMNKEQREKFHINQESIDFGGMIQRNRIEDQTVFDAMFISGQIKQSQHEAVFLFIETLSRAGAFPKGGSYEERGGRMPAYLVGDQLSMQRLAFSKPYRFVLDRCGERSTSFLMKVLDNIHCFPRKDPERREFACRVSRIVGDPLWALAIFYETTLKRDPRDIIGAQFGATSARSPRRRR